MTVMDTRQVDTVINRCRPKGDADIIVPHESSCILGTTAEEVDDPEEYAEEGWEVDLMLSELKQVVPILENTRTIRSFWGVRPLYEPPDTGSEDSRAITRNFSILDHAARDDLMGLTSIVGGKLTTYRLMAERLSDHVCKRIGISNHCQTADEVLPGSADFSVLRAYMSEFGLRSPVGRRSVERLGSRADDVLSAVDPNPVICDCESVTRAEIQNAINESGPDLNAVRIRTRASMGNCQGGLCAHQLAHELSPTYDEVTARSALDGLYEERWKGLRHALWGEQLEQAMLNHALHAATMNRDRDPAREEETINYAAFDAGPPAIGGNSTPLTDRGSHGD
jgi:glycerol-3-phosphate dehydrogenase